MGTQYNDSCRSAATMHQFCLFPAAQAQPAADGAWPWPAQLSGVMAQRFMFEHVLACLPSWDPKWHCSTAVQKDKVLASGGWRGLTEVPTSVPNFLNPQGRKETSLVSSRSVQHTPAMGYATRVTVALSQVRSSL